MDVYFLKTLFQVILIIGAVATTAGTVGTLYFNKRIEEIAPYRQLIQTGVAKIEVLVSSERQINAHFMDGGTALAFAKGGEALLEMSSVDSWGRQIGNSQVRYWANLMLDQTHSSVGKPLNFFQVSEYIQIKFNRMQEETNVISGKIVCTLNSAVRIEIQILPQQIQNGTIFVRDLTGIFAGFPKN